MDDNNFSITKRNFSTTRNNSIKKKKKYKINCASPLILNLKREISLYDKSIETSTRLLESKKNDLKVNTFIQLNSSIEEKNKSLEKLKKEKEEREKRQRKEKEEKEKNK